jgi:hypothetical protein
MRLPLLCNGKAIYSFFLEAFPMKLLTFSGLLLALLMLSLSQSAHAQSSRFIFGKTTWLKDQDIKARQHAPAQSSVSTQPSQAFLQDSILTPQESLQTSSNITFPKYEPQFGEPGRLPIQAPRTPEMHELPTMKYSRERVEPVNNSGRRLPAKSSTFVHGKIAKPAKTSGEKPVVSCYRDNSGFIPAAYLTANRVEATTKVSGQIIESKK